MHCIAVVEHISHHDSFYRLTEMMKMFIYKKKLKLGKSRKTLTKASFTSHELNGVHELDSCEQSHSNTRVQN